MNHWVGIKPKSSNQNKLSLPKVPQKNKNLKLDVDDEVARAVQQLIAMNKAEQAHGSSNISSLCNENEAETRFVARDNSSKTNQDLDNFKTPENEIPVMVNDAGRGKKTKKCGQTKRSAKACNLDGSFLENPNHVDEDDGSQYLTPKRSKFDQNVSKEVETVSLEKWSSTSNISKYLKVEGGEGHILSAYYTPGQDEKLVEYTPLYVNIGNRFQARELIGIRKNTKFVSTNSKAKMRPIEEQANYLVLSFENRKKINSPFIEYPLNRLDMIIKALEELKENAINRGFYKEQTILNCKYPENTKIHPKDDKDTVLQLMK